MERIAVALDDQALLLPKEVDLVTAQPRIDRRGREAAAPDQCPEPPLCLGACGAYSRGNRDEDRRSRVPWGPALCVADRIARDDAADDGLVERALEVSDREGRREFDQRTRGGRGANVV